MERTKRISNASSTPWRAPMIGAVAGLTYALIDRLLILKTLHAPLFVHWFSELLEFSFPAVIGGLAGLAYNHMKQQLRINRALSTENAKLERNLLTQTLGSYLLHEIRNPLHNLAAVLEGWRHRLPPEDISTFTRNVARLQSVIHHFSRWNTIDDAIDARESVRLRAWIETFIRDKVRPQLRQSHIALDLRVDPVVVRMHGLLLEQCFIPLINNAIEAVLDGEPPRAIRLTATRLHDHAGHVEIRIHNTGARYPDTVLAAQGAQPLVSQHGLGLGLVLVRRTLEHVGGSLRLSNEDGQATTTVRIPGARA